MSTFADSDKLGNVFIRKLQPGQDPLSFDNYELVKDAKFSNLRLKILVPEGGTTSTYDGMKYSFTLLGNRFNAPIPLGQFSVIEEDAIELSFQGHVNALKLFGIFDEENKATYETQCQKLKDSRYHLFGVLFSADENWKDMDFVAKYSALTFMDDEVESDEKLPYAEVVSLVSAIRNAFHKDSEAIAYDLYEKLGLHSQPLEKTRSRRILIKSCIVFRDATRDYGKRYGYDPQPVLESFAEWLDYCAVEWSREWNIDLMGSAKAEKMISLTQRLRTITVAGQFSLEIELLHMGISIPDRIRKSALFCEMITSLNLHCHKTQDYLSFEKELNGTGNEWRNNPICLLHKTKGYSIKDALAKVAQDANNDFDQFEILSEVFRSAWKDEYPHTEELIYQCKVIITNCYQGTALSSRYKKNSTMDCYINL